MSTVVVKLITVFPLDRVCEFYIHTNLILSNINVLLISLLLFISIFTLVIVFLGTITSPYVPYLHYLLGLIVGIKLRLSSALFITISLVIVSRQLIFTILLHTNVSKLFQYIISLFLSAYDPAPYILFYALNSLQKTFSE